MSKPAQWWTNPPKRHTEDLDPDSAPKKGEKIADLIEASKAKRDGKK